MSWMIRLPMTTILVFIGVWLASYVVTWLIEHWRRSQGGAEPNPHSHWQGP